CDCFGLAPEAGPLLLAGISAGQDHLQGHQPVQSFLPSLVDDAHAASAQLAQAVVTGDGRQRTTAWLGDRHACSHPEPKRRGLVASPHDWTERLQVVYVLPYLVQ